MCQVTLLPQNIHHESIEGSSSYDWTKSGFRRCTSRAITGDARGDKTKCGCRGRGGLGERLNNFAGFEERARPAMSNQKRTRICTGGALVGEMKDLQSIGWNVNFDLEQSELGVNTSLAVRDGLITTRTWEYGENHLLSPPTICVFPIVG